MYYNFILDSSKKYSDWFDKGRNSRVFWIDNRRRNSENKSSVWNKWLYRGIWRQNIKIKIATRVWIFTKTWYRFEWYREKHNRKLNVFNKKQTHYKRQLAFWILTRM